MKKHNNSCDGSDCKSITGIVKYIPLGGGGLVLCKACYQQEMAWRRERNKELSKENRFDIPAWKSLEIYPLMQKEDRYEIREKRNILFLLP